MAIVFNRTMWLEKSLRSRMWLCRMMPPGGQGRSASLRFGNSCRALGQQLTSNRACKPERRYAPSNERAGSAAAFANLSQNFD